MAHPYTSKLVGFRLFDGTMFGELVPAEWSFDGTESDIRAFAAENLGPVESITDCGSGTFDLLLEDGTDFRVYTKAVAE